MAEDDLRIPLKPRRFGSGLKRLNLGAPKVVSAALVFALLLTLAWLKIVDDPFGGEPRVVLKIDGSDRVTAGKASKEAREAPTVLWAGDEVTAAASEKRSEQRPEEVEPAARGSRGLIRAPVPTVVEDSPHGPLPRIAPDGLTPLRAYARPAGRMSGQGPKIALIIGGLGLNPMSTQRTIERLPPQVSLAFAPYGDRLQDWVDEARRKGHEILLQVPMEPHGYPRTDPGPKTLRTGVSERENMENLHWHMSRFTGYAGIVNYLGASLFADEQALRSMLDEISARGLGFFEDSTTGDSAGARLAEAVGLSYHRGRVVIDASREPDDIRAALDQLRLVAQETGFAVGTGTAFPHTVDEVAAWAETLERKGIALVPATSLLEPRHHYQDRRASGLDGRSP